MKKSLSPSDYKNYQKMNWWTCFENYLNLLLPTNITKFVIHVKRYARTVFGGSDTKVIKV